MCDKDKSKILWKLKPRAGFLHGEMLSFGLIGEISVEEAFSPVESKQKADRSLESEGPLAKDNAEWEKITEAVWG